MLKLNDWIISTNKIGYTNIIIVLDNWSYHRSKNSINILKILDYKAIFYLPYSPQVALIEMYFDYVKQKINCMMKYHVLNISNRYNHDKVFESIQFLDKNQSQEFFLKNPTKS